eukprot:gnl/MRDRNA2_/MRDRNA2_77745_c0_seq1.p1 gnl/MRDRNA2_/MRDRNA2_77745_c0~~gnl/MRDRNA2_/MRDRNA2_77745_c0_seq1.p1  ORF type:complete len:182 (+),score=11.21 gnl/MRDRNA2_/MRDRNA2_77745_c0_seq1:175-720(+)
MMGMVGILLLYVFAFQLNAERHIMHDVIDQLLNRMTTSSYFYHVDIDRTTLSKSVRMPIFFWMRPVPACTILGEKARTSVSVDTTLTSGPAGCFDQEECMICMESLVASIFAWPECGHKLHSKCAARMVFLNPSATCPLCRCGILSKSTSAKLFQQHPQVQYRDPHSDCVCIRRYGTRWRW